ncbi:MAG: rRNA pseudouridine synthase [Clostridia bacterium]|nr:rRNA pseudouridine synthase [Clostridia bacterium]
MRINKYLAECGVCSRRKADELVLQGKVSVNKKIIKELGYDIDEKNNVVFVDGKKVLRVTHYDYYMFNKPKGVVTTLDDSKDNKSGRNLTSEPEDKEIIKQRIEENSKKAPRKIISDFFGDDIKAKRLYPVGRLDYDSEGLILLTNDGDLTFRLTHPSFEVPKTYVVKIEGTIEESDLAILRKGVTVDGVKYGHCKVKVTSDDDNSPEEKGLTRLEVIIFEGKNREIRKMFEGVEKKVVYLKRVAIGDLRLGGLSRGGYRELNEMEIAYLEKLCSKVK